MNYDIDFNSKYIFIPENILSHGVSTGLFYQF